MQWYKSSNQKSESLSMNCYRIAWSIEKKIECKSPKTSKTNNGKLMVLPKCAVCDSKRSKFIKDQKASGLLSSLELKTPLTKISLLESILF